MHSVYTNALCNLSATGASDSSIGFYFERNPIVHLPFRVPSKSSKRSDWAFPPDWTSAVISEGPLSKRAWVLEERLLSSWIIHFTRAGVYWECLIHAWSEKSQYALRLEQPEAALTHSFFKRTLECAHQYYRLLSNPAVSHLEDFDLQDMRIRLREAKDTFQSVWIKQLALFTASGIDKDTDKLVALEGPSQWFRQGLGIKTMYDLLDRKLVRELAWEVRTWPPPRRDPLVLPPSGVLRVGAGPPPTIGSPTPSTSKVIWINGISQRSQRLSPWPRTQYRFTPRSLPAPRCEAESCKPGSAWRLSITGRNRRPFPRLLAERPASTAGISFSIDCLRCLITKT